MTKKLAQRSTWGSRLGFIMATSGAAVGLGNIQRFPYITAQNGGAAFVLIYLACVLIIGLPLMLVEFAIGRSTNSNPISAIKSIKPHGPWKLVGLLGILTAYFILSYYIVIAGCTVGFIGNMFRETVPTFEAFTSNPWRVLAYTLSFLFVVMFIVKKGVRKGIERYSKILMPLLLFLLLIIIIRSLTLPNSMAGLRYYLEPDFSEINAKVFLYAISQAFFSLCIGEAVLITYGSYTYKEENLISSACYIAFFDTLVAMLAGLAIFPAIFALGEQPDQGVGLIFSVLPKVFLQIPFGQFFGGIFFLLLSFAALTTSIALLEIPVACLIEEKKWSRNKAANIVTLSIAIITIPVAFSKGGSEWLSSISMFGQTGLYDIMDFAWGNLAMVVGGLLLSIFTGWVWGADKALKELRTGCKNFTWQGIVWTYIIRFLAPVAIFAILLNNI